MSFFLQILFTATFASGLPLESSFEDFKAAFDQASPLTFSAIALFPDGKPLDPKQYDRYVGEDAKNMRRVLQKWGVCKSIEKGLRMAAFVGLNGLDVDGKVVFLKYHNFDRYGREVKLPDDGKAETYRRLFKNAHSGETDSLTIMLHQLTYLKGPAEVPSLDSNFWKLLLHYRPLPDQPRLIIHPRLFEDRAIYYVALQLKKDDDPLSTPDAYLIIRNELRLTVDGLVILEGKRIEFPWKRINKPSFRELEEMFKVTPSESVCTFS